MASSRRDGWRLRTLDVDSDGLLRPEQYARLVREENDLVGTVLYLSSSESDFMTGQLLVMDGGQTL